MNKKNNYRFDLRALISNSLLEWNNKVSAVVVTGGCNWRCPYCHGWRYVTGLSETQTIDPENIFSLLAEQEGWLDGVVFSGGEPTLQPDLEKIVTRVKELNLAVKLHTNGTHPEVVKSLLDKKLIDCLALDYKGILATSLSGVAGIDINDSSLDKVKETFNMAANSNIEHEYHTTLCPKFINKDMFQKMAEELEPKGLWLLQQYEPNDCLNNNLSGLEQFSLTELEEFAKIAKEKHPNVILQVGTSR